METIYKERKAFMNLVNALCKALSYPERDEELRDDPVLVMEMTLEGIPFIVSHSLDQYPQKILIQAAFGPLPDTKRDDVLYRLLHLNRELSESGHASIGYDVTTGSVTYTHTAVLAELSGDAFLLAMTEIAWRAEYWQSTYFLQSESSKTLESFNEQFISLA